MAVTIKKKKGKSQYSFEDIPPKVQILAVKAISAHRSRFIKADRTDIGWVIYIETIRKPVRDFERIVASCNIYKKEEVACESSDSNATCYRIEFLNVDEED